MVGATTSETQRCDNVASTLSDVATRRTKNQRCYNVVCHTCIYIGCLLIATSGSVVTALCFRRRCSNPKSNVVTYMYFVYMYFVYMLLQICISQTFSIHRVYLISRFHKINFPMIHGVVTRNGKILWKHRSN